MREIEAGKGVRHKQSYKTGNAVVGKDRGSREEWGLEHLNVGWRFHFLCVCLCLSGVEDKMFTVTWTDMILEKKIVSYYPHTRCCFSQYDNITVYVTAFHVTSSSDRWRCVVDRSDLWILWSCDPSSDHVDWMMLIFLYLLWFIVICVLLLLTAFRFV